MSGETMPERLMISVLGELAVSRDGCVQPMPHSRKARALLAYCALTGRAHRRERLCELFWDLPDDPRASLRWTLTKLRPLLNTPGHERLRADREHVAIDVGDCEIDLATIRARLRDQTSPPDAEELRDMARQLDQTLLDGIDIPRLESFQAWLAAEREDAQLLRLEVLDRLASEPSLSPGESAVWSRRRAVADPYAETSMSEDDVVAASPVVATPQASSVPRRSAASSDVSPGRPSVAVLPFEVVGGEEGGLVLARGLARDITLGLARTRWLFVTSNRSAARFHSGAHDPAAVATALGVRYLLSGTLTQHDRRMRLSVTVTDAMSGDLAWAEQFDRHIDDLFAVQDEIAGIVTAAVESEIDMQERRRAVLSPLSSLDAWSAYHVATDLLTRFTPASFERAKQLLERAAALEPNSSHICAARSFLAWQRAFLELGDRRSNLSEAADLAHQAIAIDPLDAHAHWSLGRAAQLDGDIGTAIEKFETAVDLNPNFARGQYNMAWGMLMRGEPQIGIDRIDRAQRLSPFDPMTFSFMGVNAALHFSSGDLPNAAHWARRSARQPNSHHQNIANCALILDAAGEHAEALALIERIKAMRPDYSIQSYLRAAMLPADRAASATEALRRLGIP